MKKLLNLILFISISFSLFGQNPIIREELFEKYEDQWRKVSIVERAFNPQGNLIVEKQLYYEHAIQEWFPFREDRYDDIGNNVQTLQMYFQSPELGFYVNKITRQFNEAGDIVLEESIVKENKDAQPILSSRMEREQLEGCSFLQRFYRSNETESLTLASRSLTIYDENCALADVIRTTNHDLDIASLKNQVRIIFEPTSSGGQRRFVEKLACPNIVGCADWRLVNKKVYDVAGRLIIEEFGAITDFYRRIISTAYEPTQTVFTTDSYAKINDSTSQRLVDRFITTYDTEENILSSIYITPFSTRETIHEYNDKGLVVRNLFRSTEKDSTGLQIYKDTTDFLYQYYCDDLIAEQITDYGNYGLKTTFSYLNPADCGQTNPISDFLLFPNPVNSLLTIENEAFVNGSYALAIFDINGRYIRSVTNYRSNAVTIDVADLPNGIYQLSIQNEDGRITKPFTVLR